MLKRYLCFFIFGSSLILLASCSTKTEPNGDPPGKDTTVVKEIPIPNESPAARPDPREVTLHVDGMTDRLNLV